MTLILTTQSLHLLQTFYDECRLNKDIVISDIQYRNDIPPMMNDNLSCHDDCIKKHARRNDNAQRMREKKPDANMGK